MSQKFVVILAGGKGERFWPLSRVSRPKQLLPIVGKKPMLAQTVDRVRSVVPLKNIYIITNRDQVAAVRKVCPDVPRANIVGEPIGRDSGPAVGLAAELVYARDPNAVFASLHSDAAIHDTKAFQRDLAVALTAASEAPVIVTIGVKPSEASTAYGYIQRGAAWKKFGSTTIFKARRFVEKPPLATAKKYLSSDAYYWNTGTFIWSAQVVREGFARNAPELSAGLNLIGAALAKGKNLERTLAKIYPTLPRIAVDYALLEKADNVVVFPATFDWDDVGSWPAVARHHAPDNLGNILQGHALVEGGEGNIIIAGGEHLIAVLGTSNLVVVHTPDATLVCPRDKAQEIKSLLKRIAADSKLKSRL